MKGALKIRLDWLTGWLLNGRNNLIIQKYGIKTWILSLVSFQLSVFICWRITVVVCTLITEVETYCTLHPCMYFVVFVFTLDGRISLYGKPQGSSRLKTSVWPEAPYNYQNWVMHGEHAALGARTVIFGKILSCYFLCNVPGK